jgi:Transposase
MPSTPPYPEQFKRDGVALVRSSEKSIPQLAAELGVSPQSLRNWVCSLTSRSARNSLTVVASGWVLGLALGFAAAAASAMAYCCAPCEAAKGLLLPLKQKLDAVYAIVDGNESLSLAEGTDLIETIAGRSSALRGASERNAEQ